MKKCGTCLKECEDDTKTCPACGEASWVASTAEAPKADPAPEDAKRKRVR